MDPRSALLLQVEWGADEALGERPLDRFDRPPPPDPLPAHPTSTRAAPPADLQAWRAAVAASDGAGLAATASHVILPVGAARPVLAVAAAPGAEEDRSGEALAGPVGGLTRRMLASIGLDEARAMVAYLVPWRPPGGREPSESEWRASLPLLHQLIRLSDARLVLALGALPARAILGPDARRGRFVDLDLPDGVRVIGFATANPALLLRQPAAKAAAWAELRLLRRRIEAIVTGL